MLQNDDPIFDVVHSLPVLSYSVALAQRTPAVGFNQRTKYMPDYGGYLETTESCLKNNALASGIPFNTKPTRTRMKLPNLDEETSKPVICSNDCLIVTSYLNSDTHHDLSVIRLLGSNVTLHSLKQVPGERYDLLHYGHISMKNRHPKGLKLIEARNDDYLLVKYAKSVKVYNLNRSFDCDSLDNGDDGEREPTHHRKASITDRTGYAIRDASLNPYNNNVLGIASDNSNIHSIKLYDLSSSSRQPFSNIEWATLGNEFPSAESCLLSKELRGRVVRTFIPMRPTNWGTQQLDHIPFHLCNLLVTNEHNISLVDPRSSTLAQSYITKAELPSFFPVEFLRRTIFSKKNDYQFYSMTNVHLRVIDTRYPGVPVAQIGHMLESETYSSMDMKSINYQDLNLETLCCSSSSRICFLTFDQSKLGSLVNPKSTHLPYHDSSLNENRASGDLPAFGLCAIAAKLSKSIYEMFSIFQLSIRGDLLVRSYTMADELDIEQSLARVNLIDEDQARPVEDPTSTVPIRQAHELPDRVVVETQSSPILEDLIDLLDSSFLDEVENKLESKRSQEKYQLMKNKLLKV